MKIKPIVIVLILGNLGFVIYSIMQSIEANKQHEIAVSQHVKLQTALDSVSHYKSQISVFTRESLDLRKQLEDCMGESE